MKNCITKRSFLDMDYIYGELSDHNGESPLDYDGALGDPVSVEKAFAMGCDRVVVLPTRPKDVPRTSEKDEKLAARIRKKHPIAAEKLRQSSFRSQWVSILPSMVAIMGQTTRALFSLSRILLLYFDYRSFDRLFSHTVRYDKASCRF